MCAAGFPEPKTFSTRVARLLRERVGDFDVVHDNQVLGYGMLEIEEMGLPLVTTIHHPITFDRRIDLGADPQPVAQAHPAAAGTASCACRAEVARQARTDPDAVGDLQARHRHGLRRRPGPHAGDPARRRRRLRARRPEPRVPGRILAMASADAPMKGIATLLEAFAKLRTERDVELLLVTSPKAGGRTEQLIDKLSIKDSVRFVHGVSDAELVELMGSAEVACVPSLYEGFSLPTAELMACGTPLVVSRAGAIPEVVGPDGYCADLVTPGDVGELEAALADLLDDPERRARYGAAGRKRVDELFSWRAVAAKVVAGLRGDDRRLPRRRRKLHADR